MAAIGQELTDFKCVKMQKCSCSPKAQVSLTGSVPGDHPLSIKCRPSVCWGCLWATATPSPGENGQGCCWGGVPLVPGSSTPPALSRSLVGLGVLGVVLEEGPFPTQQGLTQALCGARPIQRPLQKPRGENKPNRRILSKHGFSDVENIVRKVTQGL